MKFTFDGYKTLLYLLSDNGYIIVDYHNWKEYDKCAVLRHDVDIDPQKALEMAELEYQYGIKSTYFILLTSNFYNIYSQRNRKIVNEIRNMGHTIGLHFDEMAYPEDIENIGRITADIEKELKILAEVLETNITAFSYHRPTKIILDAGIKIPRVINSYDTFFFKQFKYLSDSRMHWREPILNIVRDKVYARLHILIHPFWYHDDEQSIKENINEFLRRASLERYDDLNDNFTDLRNVIKRKEFE